MTQPAIAPREGHSTFQDFAACAAAATARLGDTPFARSAVARFAGNTLNRIVTNRLRESDFTYGLQFISVAYVVAEEADFREAIAAIEGYVRLRTGDVDHHGVNTAILARAAFGNAGELILRASSLRFEMPTAELVFAHAYPDSIGRGRGAPMRWAVALTSEAEAYLDLAKRRRPAASVTYANSLPGATRSLHRLAGVLGVDLAATPALEAACA